MTRLHRCLLFVPGSRPELLEKAHCSGADALIYDLEDSVAESSKGDARQHVARALRRASGLPVLVRVNSSDEGAMADDLAALTEPGCSLLEGILLPKTANPSAVARLDRQLARLEQRSNREPGSLAIVPLIEDCAGLRNVFDIASISPRVTGIGIASAEEGDLVADIGGRWTPDSSVLNYPRSRLVCEARAAGVEWLVDGAFMNLADNAALRREATLARDLGLVAKMAIHPSQVRVIMEVYTPTLEQIEEARELILAFEAAEAVGRGAIRHRGRMVDRANLSLARRVISLSGSV